MKIKFIFASENTIYITDELRGRCAALITSSICLKSGVKQRGGIWNLPDKFFLPYLYVFSYYLFTQKEQKAFILVHCLWASMERKPKHKFCQDYSKKAITEYSE